MAAFSNAWAWSIPWVVFSILQAGCVDPARVLHPDPALEYKTVIRRSRIPGAGMGAFARDLIREGEVIGEYGGVLRRDRRGQKDTGYLMQLPVCALSRTKPYGLLDGRGSKAHMSKVNFAPSRINGVDTRLQNARIGSVCYPPYIVFVATRDIRPGEEILTGYGRLYDYSFMDRSEVRRYFCRRLGIDCSKRFEWKP